jgi:DNA-binding transcriptional LysR family regulator
MTKLPDLERAAIFAKVAELQSFARAAARLSVSRATVSKAISRVEARLKTRLINRTSRRLILTDTGRQLAVRAAHILAEGETAEDAAVAQATVPRGPIRLATPMSFGLLHVAPLLPEFLAPFPDISIDLHLRDATVDVIGEGFDAAIRIAVLPGPTLVATRLCEMPRHVVGSSSYLDKHGRPRHPLHLAQHSCLSYSYTAISEVWHFTKGAKSAGVMPSGPLRVNNGDAMMPALIAGLGLGILPEFVLRKALAARQLERVLPDWSLPMGAVYWVRPPGEPQPRRVEVFANFLLGKLGQRVPSRRGTRLSQRQ